MKKSIIAMIFPLVLLTGCVSEDLKDEQVYIIESGVAEDGENYVGFIDTEGIDKFDVADIKVQLEPGELLLTISPDEKSYYVMDYTDRYDPYVIKGDVLEKVGVTRVDVDSGERMILAQDIPLVSKVQWNSIGTILALSGGNQLTIYDVGKEQIITDYSLQEDPVKNFAWSPIEENKLYIQPPKGYSSSMYYVDSQKKAELYESSEKIYPRGRLDEQYLYATQWRSVEVEGTKKEVLSTVLVEEDNKVIKIIGEGMYLDSYKRAVLLVEENGFGLEYIEDINQVSKGKKLSTEYIYDAKFIAGGYVAYITEDEIGENNKFLLHIVSPSGREVKTAQVSGSSFTLSYDGTIGYIGGPGQEKVDFIHHQVQAKENYRDHKGLSNEELPIIRQLQGALEIYGQVILGMEVDEAEIDRYYLNTERPRQEANKDLINLMEKQDGDGLVESMIMARLNKLDIWENSSRASIIIEVYISGANNIVHQQSLAWELVKKNNKWFVTGLSTFPNTQIYQDIHGAIQQLVYQERLNYDDEQIRPIRIGQIQFWNKEKFTLSMNSFDANLAKIDLIAREDGMEQMYVLWLKRANESSWHISSVDKIENKSME